MNPPTPSAAAIDPLQAHQRMARAVASMNFFEWEDCFNDYGPLSAAWNRFKGAGNPKGSGSPVHSLAHWISRTKVAANVAGLRELVRMGLDLDEVSLKPDRPTTLHGLARRSAGKSLIKTWLEAGADPNPVNAEGQTPMTIAAKKRHWDTKTVEALWNGGAKTSGLDLVFWFTGIYPDGGFTPSKPFADFLKEAAVHALADGAWDERLPRRKPSLMVVWATTARGVLDRLIEYENPKDPMPPECRKSFIELKDFLTEKTIESAPSSSRPGVRSRPR